MAAVIKLYAAASMPNNDIALNGGAIDTSNELTGLIDEIFKDQYSLEAGNGSRIAYRKVFFKNTAGSGSLSNAVIWMSADENDWITLDLESSKDGNDSTVNRITSPSGYSFGEHSTEGTAHAIPGTDLDPGETIGIWLKLTIPEGQSADSSIVATLVCKGGVL